MDPINNEDNSKLIQSLLQEGGNEACSDLDNLGNAKGWTKIEFLNTITNKIIDKNITTDYVIKHAYRSTVDYLKNNYPSVRFRFKRASMRRKHRFDFIDMGMLEDDKKYSPFNVKSYE